MATTQLSKDIARYVIEHGIRDQTLEALAEAAKKPFANYKFERQLPDGRKLEIEFYDHEQVAAGQSPDSLLVVKVAPSLEHHVGYLIKELGLNGELETLVIYIGTKTWVTIPKQEMQRHRFKGPIVDHITSNAEIAQSLAQPYQEVYDNLMKQVFKALFEN